ncbi:M67 family metallopeptidase [Treponema primitia]|uniref:M67 family metallopeptidase n=1 Tax=Treponema primitia TaxID=88058 RepID=UPI003980D2E1
MLILPREYFDRMIAHALTGLPNEACGLFAGEIAGDNKTVKEVYCLTNTDKSAEHFSMAPEEQFKAIADMRKKGYTLLGNFHSHPATPARPSEEDIHLAFDPSLSYIIISLKDPDPALKSFVIRNGAAAEEPVQV